MSMDAGRESAAAAQGQHLDALRQFVDERPLARRGAAAVAHLTEGAPDLQAADVAPVWVCASHIALVPYRAPCIAVQRCQRSCCGEPDSRIK